MVVDTQIHANPNKNHFRSCEIWIYQGEMPLDIVVAFILSLGLGKHKMFPPYHSLKRPILGLLKIVRHDLGNEITRTDDTKGKTVRLP